MVFSSPAPAPHHNLGRGCKRLLACPPAAPQRLPHVAAHRLIVVCYFFHVFHDPREGCGGLRPPGGAAAPKNSETAVLVVSAPNGDAWRSRPMATAYR